MAVDPLEWRQRSVGLTWRIAKLEDMAKLREIHLTRGGRVNDSVLPALDEKPVLLTLVAEDEHGEIVYGAYVEVIPHIRAIGRHSNGIRSLLGIKPMLRSFLKGAGFRMVKVNFRRQMTPAVRPYLEEAGFTAEDQQGPNFQFLLS